MITQAQIKQLSDEFKIDQVTVFREYLQLVFLNQLYQLPDSNKIYFKGGTAIHLLLNSPRFSEDLDFSTSYHQPRIEQVIKTCEHKIKLSLPELMIKLLYHGRKTVRFRIKYQPPDFKYPLVIRVDFTEKERPEIIKVSPLVTSFPIMFFPVVSHLSAEEILAEKVRALMVRAKGRDFFDLWYLLAKNVPLSIKLVEKKLQQVNRVFSKTRLINKIRQTPQSQIEQDLRQFLPPAQKKLIPQLKSLLLRQLSGE